MSRRTTRTYGPREQREHQYRVTGWTTVFPELLLRRTLAFLHDIRRIFKFRQLAELRPPVAQPVQDLIGFPLTAQVGTFRLNTTNKSWKTHDEMALTRINKSHCRDTRLIP